MPADVEPDDVEPDDDLEALIAEPLLITARRGSAPTSSVLRSPADAPAVAVRGADEWFQPLAGGVLPMTHQHDGRPAALLTTGGPAVIHSPATATVSDLTAAGELVLACAAGRTVTLAPDGGAAWGSRVGDAVAAGQVLGRFGHPPQGHPAAARLVIVVTAADGTAEDAVALLSGLPDPDELGPDHTGPGSADPFDHDLELARRIQPDPR